MSPKEKAIELVDKMTLSSNAQDGSWMCKDLAKQCALIAVEEMIFNITNIAADMIYYNEAYLIQVKNEIEKL